MTPLQQDILLTLKEFDDFCQEHNVVYFLMWGTLLGAIREKGFIPWDDDIDIAMDLKNFKKLKNLASEGKLPSHLAFEDSLFIKGCRVPKIRNKKTNIVDLTGGYGVFIDIFPFQRYSEIEKSILTIASYGLKYRDFRGHIKNYFLRKLFTFTTIPPYLLFIATRAIMSKKTETSDGPYIGKSVNTNPEIFFDFKNFSSTTKKTFEGFDFPVPIGFASILERAYGDWRTPIDCNNVHYDIQ